MKHLFFILLTLASYFSIQAQPVEFDTYFAFEDAAGRRDTVWYGARLDATSDYDPQYEELVKQPIDSTTFVVLSNIFDHDIFFKKKFYESGVYRYAIYVMFTFIDAAYPIHVKMNIDFVQNLDWFELTYNKYIGTWCEDPHLVHPWNDSTSVFDCIDIETGEFVINEPPSTDPVELYCQSSPNQSYINIKGKGEVTLNAFAVLTFIDKYCRLTGLGNSTLKRLGDDAIVYPNPSNGSFEIKTLWQSGLLRIFDYRGQTVKKVILQSDREKYSFSLDPGLYFAVVEHNGVFKPLGKIVVER